MSNIFESLAKANEYQSKADEHNNTAYKLAIDIAIKQASTPIKDIPTNAYFVMFGEFGIVDFQKLDKKDHGGLNCHCINSWNGTFEKGKSNIAPINQLFVPWANLIKNKQLLNYYSELT